jgi:hypothetical protein
MFSNARWHTATAKRFSSPIEIDGVLAEGSFRTSMLAGVSDSQVLPINPPLPPLVDFPKPKAPDLSIVWVGFGVGLGLGVLAGVLRSMGHNELTNFLSSISSFRPFGLLLTIGGVAFTLIFQVLGQILASTVTGWKTTAVALGPLRLTRSGKRWRIGMAKTFWHSSVTSVPRDARSPGWRLSVILAAAPLSLLAAAAISLLAYMHLSGSASLRNYFAAATLFGFAAGLLSLVPNARSARVWNGARFCLALLTADPELQQRVTTIRLSGLSQRARPRDFPLDLISAAAEPATDSLGAVVRASVIGSWCLDRKDFASAGAWYDRLAELAQYCVPAVKNAALASSACFDLAWKENPQDATRKLDDVKPELLATTVPRLCTQALVHILNGERSRAEAKIALAEAECSGAFGDYQRETLARLRAIAEGTGLRGN